MPPTFTSRKLVRDELVTLFAATGNWQNVYGYIPDTGEIVGKTPLLIILSRGTEQEMAGLETNPVTYRFVLTSMVLAYSATDAWTSALAADKVDELDMVFRQVIRDNVGSLATANTLRFEAKISTVEDVLVENKPYILERWAILAHLDRGVI